MHGVTDFLGQDLHVGDVVVKAGMLGRSPKLQIREVTEIIAEGSQVRVKPLGEGRREGLTTAKRLISISRLTEGL